jgi:uncharacterized protein (DUF2336 family)
MAVDLAFFHEIESAVVAAPGRRRGEMVRRVTDLFIVGSADYSDNEVGLFDDVLGRLMVDIEASARAMLAERLAPIANAPRGTVRKLALDGNIDVAGPVLVQSERLDDQILIEVAAGQSQEHLLAISRRRSLSAGVTDVLVERGDHQIVLSTVENGGARFSDAGFARLVQRSDGDDRLAACVGLRPEIPPHLLLKLLAMASQAVRGKLEAAYPQAKGEVHRVIAYVAGRIGAKARAETQNYDAAQQTVAALRQAGKLDDGKVGAFAKAARLEETTAALALMCELPLEFVEGALMQKSSETVVVLAKASGLSWPTLKAILLLCAGKYFTAGSEITHSLAKFDRLQLATAHEIVRFYRRRAQAATPRSA